MPNLEQIKNHILLMDEQFVKYADRKELPELVRLLGMNETIEYIVDANSGSYAGLLIGTNLRLMFITKTLQGVGQTVFNYDKILKLEQGGANSSFGSLLVTVPNLRNQPQTHTFDYIAKNTIAHAYNWLRAKASSNANSKLAAPIIEAQPEPVALMQDELLEKLERLAKLKELGVLTDEEFLAQKQQLLSPK